jgi:glycine/D-amino acid oxidase-like deaminating enzyme
MSQNFDVIVVGLGAMGSATLYQLARLGIKALGIDRFRPPHAFGSSHGESRFTRQAGGGAAVKVATEQYEREWSGEPVPEAALKDARHEMFQRHVHGRLRGVREPGIQSVSCLYSVTPDSGFVIDRHPGSDRAWIVSACSGHGFKHSAAVGEALARWVALGEPPGNLDKFSLKRFQ